MRVSLWLLALFASAVAAALFAGSNPGSVTLFWPPYRVDFSLNLVLVLLLGSFLTLHLALRALSALFSIPSAARAWRARQRERSLQLALLDAYSQFVAGRFVRSKKAAELVLEQLRLLQRAGESPEHAALLQAVSHLMAADAAHSLQDRTAREQHYRSAIDYARRSGATQTHEGAQLRAARWALDDRDAVGALQFLDDMGQGAARRTLALRMRLKAARMGRQTMMAMETARVLAKHHALSQSAAHSVLSGLAIELISSIHDPAQLQQAWGRLGSVQRDLPDVAIAAAQRLLALGGEPLLGRQWLLAPWEQLLAQPAGLEPPQSVKLVRALEHSFAASAEAPDVDWLKRIESAQLAHPGDAVLQYLAGMTCMRLQLWGKARQLLTQAVTRLQDPGLRRDAWRQLAELAQEQGDSDAAAKAWRSAAQVG